LDNLLVPMESKLDPLVATFLSGRNANTREAYRADLSDFAAYSRCPDTAEAIALLLGRGQGAANLMVLEFRNALVERGLQSSTINRRLSSVRAVVKLARTLGIVVWALDVPNVKAQSYRDTTGVGLSGVGKMLTELERRNNGISLRDTALVRLFFDIGLRVTEAVTLDLEHIDLDQNVILVLGKGRTQREKMSIPEQTATALRRWVGARPTGESAALFLNFDRAKKGSGRITRSGVYLMIRGLGADLNMKSRPHGLRHDSITAAVSAAQVNDIELPSVLKFSRHKSLVTLMKYVDAVANRQGEIAALVASSVETKRSR
jgi:integrase/recombinase XerC